MVCHDLPTCCPAEVLANGLFEAVDPLMGLPSILSCSVPSDLFRSWGKRDRLLELAGAKVKQKDNRQNSINPRGTNSTANP